MVREIGSQKNYRSCNIFSRCDTAKRDSISDPLQQITVLAKSRGSHIGIDPSRRNTIDAHIEAAKFRGERFGKADDRAFRCSIIRVASLTTLAGGRTDVHYISTPLLDKNARRLAADIENPIKIYPDRFLPLGFIEFANHPLFDRPDSRICDQHIETTEFSDGLFDERSRLVETGNISLNDKRSRACTLDCPGGSLGCCPIPLIVDYDTGCACLGEFDRRCCPDATRSSGDQNDLISKRNHCFLFPSLPRNKKALR